LKALRTILLFFICSVFSFGGYTQQQIDSLILEIQVLEETQDTLVVKKTLDQVRSRIEAGGLEDDLTKLSQSTGEYYSRTFEYDSAIKYFRKALDFALENSDTSLLAMSYYNLGGAYCDVESYPYSTELYLNSLDLWKAKKDTFRIAKTILAIANNYYYFGDFQIGQDYYKQSIELFRLLGDTSNLSKSIGNSAALFAYKKQFDTAMALYDEALSLVKYSKYTDVFVNNLIGIGMVYEELGKYDTAYNFYKRAFYESKRIDYKIQESFSYLNFAYYFMYKDIFDSAEFYALKALDQSELISNKLLKVNSYDVLHEIYYKTGQYKEAYDYLMLTKEKNDSLYNISRQRQLEAINARYSLKEKEAELANAKLQLSLNQNFLDKQLIVRNALIAVLFLFLLVISLIYRSQRIKSKTNELLNRKNREIQQKSKEIKDIEAAKSRWFINISHELRTPLTLIKGPMEILSNDELSNENKRNLQIALRNVKKLESLVNEILDLTKIEEGTVDLNYSQVEIDRLLSELITSFDSSAKMKNIAFSYRNQLTESTFLKIDKNKISKVINNLLTNALKFTPEDGSITVRLLESADDVIIEISDTGDGISKDEVHHIFDRFYQSKNSKQVGNAGSGIGLSLSKEIVSLHQGDIKVKSRLGKGSTFSIMLPSKLKIKISDITDEIENIEKDEFASSFLPNLQKSNKSILVVEDNADMREFIVVSLENYYNVFQAKDGKEALKVIENNIPDLIVSDIMMPRMDGKALARELKSNEEWKAIPFIALTALSEENQRVDTLRIGVDDYMVKPFNIDELLVRIQNLLHNFEERVQSNGENDIISYDDKIIKKLEEEVLENIDDLDLSVAKLAISTNFSERQLYRYLKQTTGLTPANFIKEIRLQRAHELARKRAYNTATELAGAVGFSSGSYFNTVFKSRFGVSPSSILKV